MTVTTYLAALTTRTQLGISVLVLPKRSPVLVAKGAATLDVLNGGRLVLGVGAGYHELQFRWLGGENGREPMSGIEFAHCVTLETSKVLATCLGPIAPLLVSSILLGHRRNRNPPLSRLARAAGGRSARNHDGAGSVYRAATTPRRTRTNRVRFARIVWVTLQIEALQRLTAADCGRTAE